MSERSEPEARLGDSSDLDERTVDRLLAGELAPHEAPPGWERVAALLRAAGSPSPAPDPSADLLRALVRVAGGTPARGRSHRRTTVVAGIAAGLVLAGTGAAAAAGSLPDPVQDLVHDVVAVVGVDVPEGSPAEFGPPTTSGSQDGPGHGRSDEAPGRPAVPGEDTGSRADEAPGQPEDPGRSTEAPGPAEEREQPVPSSTIPAPPTAPTPPSNPNADGGNPNAGGANSENRGRD